MGNKQNNESKIQESIINNNESQIQKSDAQPKFTIDVSRKTQLTFPSDLYNPAQINVSLDGFTFWSNYDSGNLSYVEKVNDSTFNLSIANDCQGRDPKIISNKGTRCWFNFKIVSEINAKADFVIINIATRFKKIWTNDSDIYVKINKQWSRYPAVYQGFQVKFSFEFKSQEIVQFAFVPPWSYKKNQKYLDLYSSQLHPNIYFRRDVIAKSLDGRNIELITITQNGDSEKQGYYCTEYLFPEKNEKEPLLKFKKPYIFISSRVHAGEVPASCVLKGILETFKDYKPSAQSLLKRFVFIIIPMLNPDGVYRGHYRLDSLGYDENRVYNRLVKYPKFNGPLAVLETCKNYDVRLYLDLHAHSVLTNSFIFSNFHSDPQIQEAILAFPRQLKQRVHHFRLKEALSTQINQEKSQYEIEGAYTENDEQVKNATDLKIHISKEQLVCNNLNNDCPFASNPYLTGVAKSDVYFTSAVMLSYTLETNYRYYIQNKQIRKYQVSDFENLGREVLESLNDLLSSKEKSQFQVIMQSQIFN